MSSQPNILHGIGLKAAATVGIALTAAIAKALSAHYPLGEILFFRSAFTFIAIMPFIMREPAGLMSLRTTRLFDHVRRGFFGTLSLAGTYLTLRFLPLADATAITFSAPLFLVALAVPLLHERVGVLRWAAVITGFLGVLLIAQPRALLTGTAPPEALVGVICGLTTAVSIALVQFSLRALREESAATTVFYFTLTATVTSAFTLPFAFLWPQSAWDGVLLVLLGLLGGISQLFQTQSYRVAPASSLAAFDYLQLIWALIIGYFIFDERPAVTMLAGAVIVAGSGLFIVLRERHLARRGRQDIEPALPQPPL